MFIGDWLSMGASFLCAIHCVFLPVFFSTLPLWGIEIIENMWLEVATIMVTAIIGSWAIWRGYKNFHRSKLIVALFGLGFLLMLIANIHIFHSLEHVLKLAGAVLITFAHIKNWKKSHHCIVN